MITLIKNTALVCVILLHLLIALSSFQVLVQVRDVLYVMYTQAEKQDEETKPGTIPNVEGQKQGDIKT